MRKKVILMLSLSLIVMVLGIRWAHLENLSKSSTVALDYLKDEGLFVLYNKGEYGPYYLTKSDINEKPYNDFLLVQNQTPEFFIDKELHHKFFYVNNHPLSSLFGVGGVFVTVMMSGEEVIGAFSVKNGVTYSLSGKVE